jgi:hypothetical protein
MYIYWYYLFAFGILSFLLYYFYSQQSWLRWRCKQTCRSITSYKTSESPHNIASRCYIGEDENVNESVRKLGYSKAQGINKIELPDKVYLLRYILFTLYTYIFHLLILYLVAGKAVSYNGSWYGIRIGRLRSEYGFKGDPNAFSKDYLYFKAYPKLCWSGLVPGPGGKVPSKELLRRV